jgi:hypothetical protein
MNKQVIDISGKKFNRWSVIKYLGTDKRNEAMFLCECDCGTKRVLLSSTLRYGTSKGCTNCRTPSKIAGSTYSISGDTAIFLTSKGEKIIVSLEDAEKAGAHTWCISKDGYPVATINRKTTKLHHYLLGTTPSSMIDHKNGNKLDNCRENLRFASFSENASNMRMRKDNTSGFKGVFWNKKDHTWCSVITFKGKTYRLGNFINKNEAALAYNEAAKNIHKEFACLNPIGKTEGYRICKEIP